MDISALKQKLTKIGQGHVLQFFDRLNESGKKRLAAQVEALDLDNLQELIESQVKQKAAIPLPKEIKPVDAYPRVPDARHKELYQNAEKRGRELLKLGKIGAFLVAGGQGTRLGYDGPKGEFPVTPIKNKPLFQVFAEQLLAHSRDSGKPVPWYIMTSDTNDQATRAFFKKHNHFGYDPSDIMFFQQGMMPMFAFDGKMLLSEKNSLGLGPDGHGGSLRAIAKSGALADMKKRGVEHLSYFQVDNPLVHTIDPLFIGLHDLTGSELSSKTIGKAHALEKVGNFVFAARSDSPQADGAVQVIEYSDLPESLAKQTNPDGSLKFNAGSIAIHALRVSFIERLNAGGQLKLPWHRAEKKVPYVDASGTLVKPDKPNAVKLEQFVFDAIPLAKNAIVYETRREEEFSPVKNADGADSPATCKRDQLRRAARWLTAAGVSVPMNGEDPAATIEISPLFATTPEQVKAKAASIKPIGKDAKIVLE
jgi:UDP-N-acetylglucosamine/UDP-N-acetylgalactosamine diphosphorylase